MGEILSYSTEKHRWRARRIAAVAALVLALATIAYFAPTFWRRVRMLYWQHQCMIFSAPPDAVVCERKSPGVADSPRPSGFVDEPPGIPPSWMTHFRPRPSIGHGGGKDFIERAPACWLNFDAATGYKAEWLMMEDETVAFIHERTSKGGVSRLVVVAIELESMTGDGL
ncbi:MAG TPA: hypothetical protein VMD30_06360, partial [Tepidisphaeraceae bacterium]|nr:hypothetical protein [Tepidisphaeraceae bacterium]